MGQIRSGSTVPQDSSSSSGGRFEVVRSAVGGQPQVPAVRGRFQRSPRNPPKSIQSSGCFRRRSSLHSGVLCELHLARSGEAQRRSIRAALIPSVAGFALKVWIDLRGHREYVVGTLSGPFKFQHRDNIFRDQNLR